MSVGGVRREVRESVEFEDGEECFLRDLYPTDLLHAFLTFFLLFKQFAFSADVAAVALCGNVFANGLDGLTGYYLGADGSLDGDVKLLARDEFLEFLTHSSAEFTELSAWVSVESASTLSPLSRMSSLTRFETRKSWM